MTKFGIGQPVRRVEDQRFLTGQGRYVDDINLTHQAYGALVLSPRIILMDEPFGALDPTTRLNMQALLVQLWQEAQATVFFVTHSIEEAVYLGDRVYIFSSAPGTILKEMAVPKPHRPTKEMQREPAFLEKVFEIRDIIENLASSTRAGDD